MMKFELTDCGKLKIIVDEDNSEIEDIMAGIGLIIRKLYTGVDEEEQKLIKTFLTEESTWKAIFADSDKDAIAILEEKMETEKEGIIDELESKIESLDKQLSDAKELLYGYKHKQD